MVKEYLVQLEVLVGPLVGRRVTGLTLEFKHFFSGAAIYVNGKICMTLTPVGFALKLPEVSRNLLKKRKGTKPLRYFPKGPVKKDYVVLPKTMLKDRRTLRRWVENSIQYVLST